MDKLGHVVESNDNGEVRKHIGRDKRAVYFVWAKDAKNCVSFPTFSAAREAIGINVAPSERAVRAMAERHAADVARKEYVTKRNANHKGK